MYIYITLLYGFAMMCNIQEEAISYIKHLVFTIRRDLFKHLSTSRNQSMEFAWEQIILPDSSGIPKSLATTLLSIMSQHNIPDELNFPQTIVKDFEYNLHTN